MRRKVGVAAISGRKDDAIKYTAIGREIEQNKITFVRDTIESFKSTLSEFASKHRDRINSDPEFRMIFHEMCTSVGVDPLASSKGFWAELLGVGDYYFRLGVIIVKTCVKLRRINGGIISLIELCTIIQSDSNYRNTGIEDVKRAINALQILGNGFRLVDIGGIKMVLSVPLELNKDHEEILDAAYSTFDSRHDKFVDVDIISQRLGWPAERFELAIAPLVVEGLLWIDIHEGKNVFFTISSSRMIYGSVMLIGKERYYLPNFNG